MAGHQTRTARLSDEELVDRWFAFAKDIGAGHVAFLVGNEQIFDSIPVDRDPNHVEHKMLMEYLAVGGTSDLGARVDASRHKILYVRDTPFDSVSATLPDAQHKQPQQTIKVIAALKKHFQGVDLNGSLTEWLSADLKRYYETREATLVRLEQLTEKLISDNEEFRVRLDAETAAYKQTLDAAHVMRSGTLDEREQQLKRWQEELDLADPKSTRRKMRQSILDKLKPQGVMSLDRAAMLPIHAMFIVVAGVLLFSAWQVLSAEGFDPLVPTHAVKLGLSSLGLVGTMLLYFRWMDAWLRKGVDENLRMRQLAIDVDRSTWVVEVLSELKSETGSAIPDEVLSALTRNLFAERAGTAAVTHPVEDILSSLLGSSRKVRVDFPHGTVETDGKAIRKAVRESKD